MSSSDHKLDIVPGDIVAAVHEMRAWETDEKRGWSGHWIQQGDQAMVIQTWFVGNQRRVKVMCNNRFMLFSCGDHCVFKNWRMVTPAPRTTTSEGP